MKHQEKYESTRVYHITFKTYYKPLIHPLTSSTNQLLQLMSVEIKIVQINQCTFIK